MAALDKRDVWLGCAGALEVMGWSSCRSRKFPVFGAEKRAGQHERRERWLQMVEAGFFSSSRTR